MTFKVFKYGLKVAETSQAVRLPKQAAIIHVDMDLVRSDIINLWAVVNVDAPPVDRYFSVFGTGQDIIVPPPDKHRELFHYNIDYTGTAVDRSLRLVWHVFELVKLPTEAELEAAGKAAMAEQVLRKSKVEMAEQVLRKPKTESDKVDNDLDCKEH